MAESRTERRIFSRDSSWNLLDRAARLEGVLKPRNFWDCLGRRLLAIDDGQAIERDHAISALRKLFGENHG